MPLKQRLAWLAFAPALILAAEPASALTCTATTNPVPFGVYSTSSTVDNTTVSVLTVTCQSLVAIGVSYTISLTAGASGSASARAMTTITPAGTVYALNYQLYSDLTYSTIWGDGTGTSRTVTDSFALALLGIPVPKTYTVYAKIPARQNAAAGTYQDTISVLVAY